MNNQDQFQKDVYQVPSSQSGESLNAPAAPVETELSQQEVDQRFYAVEQEYVQQVLSDMARDLEMSASGFEQTQPPVVELMTPHPIAADVLQIGTDIKARRAEHHESLIESARLNTPVGRFITKLFAKDATASLTPTFDKIIEHESKLGAKLFPVDPDVTEVKFFFLPDEEGDKWYHTQVSPVRAKHFTNSYTIRETGIEKSSTFFDEHLGRIVNVSVPISDEEARNLLIAAKNYYTEVTGKVYVKPPAPRFRFGSKSR